MSEYVVLIAWLSPGAGAHRHLGMPCLNLACAQWHLQPRYGEAVFATANSHNDAASDGCEA
eukprot:3945128-Alexandrium_andersonii.AAC.1